MELEAGPQAASGGASGSEAPQALKLPKRESPDSPAGYIRREVATERAKLELRELKGMHQQLDEEELAQKEEADRKERAVREHERQIVAERAGAGRRAEIEAEDHRRREVAEAGARKRRSAITQAVIDQAIEGYGSSSHATPPGVKGAAIRTAREALALVQIDTLPRAELLTIVLAAMNTVIDPYLKAEEKEELLRKERAVAAEKERDKQRRLDEQHRLDEQRRQVVRKARIEAGIDHAKVLLEEAGMLPSLDFYQASEAVRTGLSREITGMENLPEAEKLASELVAPYVEKFKKEAERLAVVKKKEKEEFADFAKKEKEGRKRQAEEIKRTARNKEFLEYAKGYALAELTKEEIGPSIDRWLVLEKLKGALKEELDQDENLSKRDVVDFVEAFLNEELE